KLKKLFGDKVITNVVVNYKYPDIALIDYGMNFCLDIEIDEVYTLKTKEIIHTKGSDNERDIQIINSGWYILRFSEEQVIKQPDSCCKFVSQLYAYYTLNKIPLKIISHKPDLIFTNQWDYKAAKEMLSNNYRGNLLGVVQNEYEELNNSIE